MSCISNLLFTCIPCLCDIKFYKQKKKKKKKRQGNRRREIGSGIDRGTGIERQEQSDGDTRAGTEIKKTEGQGRRDRDRQGEG